MNDVLSTPVVLAAIGGLAVNLLNLLELQQVPKERRPDFWPTTIILSGRRQLS